MRRGFRVITVVVVVGVGGVFFAGALLLRPTLYEPPVAAPATAPGAAFDVARFEDLLARFGRPDGGADYAAWRADASAVLELDRFLATVAAVSPSTDPTRFPDATHRLRYWLHAAQAAQIRVVLETGAASVLDLPAPLALVAGDGLLRRRSFRCGGVVHTILRIVADRLPAETADPRIVFALGGVAPALGPLAKRIPTGAAFADFLAARSAAFFASPEEFQLDPTTGTLRLAPRLFRWRDLFSGRPRPGGESPTAAFNAALSAAAPEDVRSRLAVDGALRTVRPINEDWRIR